MNEVHVMPTADLITHDSNDECACGPTPQFVDGGVLHVHHSLDNREGKEPK